MTIDGIKVEKGMGVKVIIPGTRYLGDFEVIDVYDTHVIILISGKEAQVGPHAVRELLSKQRFQEEEILRQN